MCRKSRRDESKNIGEGVLELSGCCHSIATVTMKINEVVRPALWVVSVKGTNSQEMVNASGKLQSQAPRTVIQKMNDMLIAAWKPLNCSKGRLAFAQPREMKCDPRA